MDNDFNFGFGSNLGQTETIFTTSGGQSGSGFTGVSIGSNGDFSRLVTQIGPAPGCALGNCCGDGFANNNFCGNSFGLGSIVDIPFNRRAAIVHNAVGFNWF